MERFKSLEPRRDLAIAHFDRMADQMFGDFGMGRMRSEPFGNMGGIMREMDQAFERSHRQMEQLMSSA